MSRPRSPQLLSTGSTLPAARSAPDAGDAYWSSFYTSELRAAVPEEPSGFARWTASRLKEPILLVDVGTGTARDSLWFSRRGSEVLGLDYAVPAIDQARRAAARDHLRVTFEVFDLNHADQVEAMGSRLADGTRAPLLYGRFLIHALRDDGRQGLWRLASQALRVGGTLYLEFRTGKDAGAPHEFGEHFRKFLDPESVVDEIEQWGGTIEYRNEGHGLAPYRHEDPHVCRLVSTWKR